MFTHYIKIFLYSFFISLASHFFVVNLIIMNLLNSNNLKIELFKDIIFLLPGYVEYIDILHFSITCKALRNMIFNIDFWKRILYSKYKSDMWGFVTFDEVYEPIKILFSHKRDKNIFDQFVKYNYIMYRLSDTQSSKNFLKFYAKIDTPSLPEPHSETILVGDIISRDEVRRGFINLGEYREFFIRFKKLDGNSVYYWTGEESHVSIISFYIVDRRLSGSVIHINPDRFLKNSSILGKKDYKSIGKILYNDENFYQSSASTNYKYSDSHSSQRFRDERFGENNNSVTYPHINISCITHIDSSFRTDDIFSLTRH